jgi:protein SCO1
LHRCVNCDTLARDKKHKAMKAVSMLEEPKFNRNQWIVWGCILLVLLIVSIIPMLIPHYHSVEYDSPHEVDFTLDRADGGTFHLRDYRGKVVVLYFGYTQCPDVCPTTLLDLHRMMEALGDNAQEVSVAFITVDPENDTPEKMIDYLRYFDASFIGLVGTPEALQQAYDVFNINVLSDEETAGGYGVGHTTSTFVVDRAGRLRLEMHYGSRPDHMADDVKRLVRESGS